MHGLEPPADEDVDAARKVRPPGIGQGDPAARSQVALNEGGDDLRLVLAVEDLAGDDPVELAQPDLAVVPAGRPVFEGDAYNWEFVFYLSPVLAAAALRRPR